jgi:hypothetical protein
MRPRSKKAKNQRVENFMNRSFHQRHVLKCLFETDALRKKKILNCLNMRLTLSKRDVPVSPALHAKKIASSGVSADEVGNDISSNNGCERVP